MISIISKIANLQTKYSSKNTPEMKKRGILIRNELPNALKVHWQKFKKSIGKYASDLEIESSDGMGNKTQAPWVRMFSKSLSPSATDGYYMVIHFSINGLYCFVTVGCASTKLDRNRGSLKRIPKKQLAKKIKWVENTLKENNAELEKFTDRIELGSKHPLPKSFEDATAICQKHEIKKLTEDELVESICVALKNLSILYDYYSQLCDLSESEISEIKIDSALNPVRKSKTSRQGYGLNSEERKFVEIHAMLVVKDHLESTGFKVKDVSSTRSYDYIAKKNDKEIMVEVKGTTSHDPDAILMTKNEVELHNKYSGKTALAIVSGIKMKNRGDHPRCEDGILEYIYPWDISNWKLTPTSFSVQRPKDEV